VYLDIKAAFDSVDRLALWKALRGRGIPDVLLDLITALHENTSVCVRLGKQLSDPLSTTSGVRQGCVLAPALFCVAIDWILKHMKSRPGITIGRDLFTDLVYADDTALFIESPASAATCLSSFEEMASAFGLQVSWPKTKTQNLGSGPQPDTIIVNGNHVDAASDFVYLGSSQSSDGQCRPDIQRRIGFASAVMSSLDNIWKNKRLSLSIKLHVFLALVQSVLLYASETWTLTVADSKTLDAFHMKCQRRILGISWHQFVRNEEIAARAGLPSLSTTICCRRSAIFGHLARLGDEVPTHKALHSCVRLSQRRLPDPTWKRCRGRPRGKWIDQLQKDNNRPPADQWKLSWLSGVVMVEERRYGPTIT